MWSDVCWGLVRFHRVKYKTCQALRLQVHVLFTTYDVEWCVLMCTELSSNIKSSSKAVLTVHLEASALLFHRDCTASSTSQAFAGCRKQELVLETYLPTSTQNKKMSVQIASMFLECTEGKSRHVKGNRIAYSSLVFVYAYQRPPALTDKSKTRGFDWQNLHTSTK